MPLWREGLRQREKGGEEGSRPGSQQVGCSRWHHLKRGRKFPRISRDCKGCWAWHTSRGGKKGWTAVWSRSTSSISYCGLEVAEDDHHPQACTQAHSPPVPA
ncbi:Glycerol-3-Phosphate Acyltransferase 1 [Manis pentadactyla]|nr:Glycerol-3-Phosphate Acyltransferase 1 [Manis pentadactyla]